MGTFAMVSLNFKLSHTTYMATVLLLLFMFSADLERGLFGLTSLDVKSRLNKFEWRFKRLKYHTYIKKGC